MESPSRATGHSEWEGQLPELEGGGHREAEEELPLSLCGQ